MTHHVLTAAILLLALTLYAFGMSGGGSLLLALGAAMELWFWVRVLQRRRDPERPAPSADR
jgi:hypothetical protein